MVMSFLALYVSESDRLLALDLLLFALFCVVDKLPSAS